MVASKESVDRELSVVFLSFGLRGGMTQYTAELANELANSVSLTAIVFESEENRSVFGDDVELVEIKTRTGGLSPGWLWYNALAFLKIHWHIHRKDSDVIHVPFLAGVFPTLTTILLGLYQSPVIATVHEPRSQIGLEIERFGIDFRERLMRVAASVLDVVVVKGEVGREAAREVGYPMEKVRSFPHGLYNHFLEFVDDDVSTDANTLLFFGNLRPDKGFDRIPEIVDAVAGECPEVRAIVAGSPDVAAQIDDETVRSIVIALRNHDRIELHAEYVPTEDVAAYFQRASIVVLPYYDATMSGVAMIAYTFGVPMVSTDIGEHSDMIAEDGSGLLAATTSTSDISAKAVDLLSDDDLYEECRRNLAANKENYSWEKIAERTLELYRDAVD